MEKLTKILDMIEGSLNGSLDALEFDNTCDVIEKSFVIDMINDLKKLVEEAQAEELRKDCDRCKKLEFMIDSGLGWKDMVNDNKPAN